LCVCACVRVRVCVCMLMCVYARLFAHVYIRCVGKTWVRGFRLKCT